MSDAVAAEGTSSSGAPTEVTTDLGATSTEGAGSQAESGSAEEPILYAVKVGGKEEQVTFDELQKGYMRQGDYTRKTQELSQEKQRLAQAQQLADALERDPKGTITALAGYLNVDFGTAAAVAQQVAGDDDDPLLRLEKKFEGFTQQLTAREQAEKSARDQATQAQAIQAQIEGELQALHGRYGEFPDAEVCQYAADHGVNNLDAAYKAWQFEAQDTQRLAELNAATEAKRRAQVVSGGHSTAPAAVARGPANGRMTIDEALQAALRAHT